MQNQSACPEKKSVPCERILKITDINAPHLAIDLRSLI
jgi:hypothetical protein